MIPNFNSYNIINESVSLNELQKDKSSYGTVKRNFTSKGYECLGNITFEHRHRKNLKYPEVLDVIPDDLSSRFREKELLGFVSGKAIKDFVDVNLWGTLDEDKFLSVFREPNIENVKACITQKGDLYYCLYNDEKKYFYYVTFKKPAYYINDAGATQGCFELFIKLRTSGIEEIEKEIDDYCDEYPERQRAEEEKKRAEEEERLRKEEERRIQREKEEEERRIKKEKEEAYEKRVEVIKADVEENPENYEMVDWNGLPDEIRDELKSDDYMDSKYVKYVLYGKWDPYDNESIMVYVNDDNLTKGYKYSSSIGHARQGTYWGD